MASLPLVLLPGLLCDARLWRDPAAALADLAPVHHADLTLDDSVAGMAARVLATHGLERPRDTFTRFLHHDDPSRRSGPSESGAA